MTNTLPDGVVVTEVHREGIGPRLPRGALRSRNLTLPLEHVGAAIGVADGPSDEPKGMISSPLLAFFLKPVDHQLVNLLFLHD